MAITVIGRVSRAGEADYRGGTRTYTDTYLIRSDDTDDTPGEIADALALAAFAAYEDDPICRHKSKSATQSTEDRHFWSVSCVYDYQAIEQGQGFEADGTPAAGEPGESGADVQPDDRKWTLSIEAVEVPKPFVKEVITDNPVTASNGQPYDPPLEGPGYMSQLTVSGWKAIGADGFTNIGLYQNKVNTDTWWGLAAGRCLCKSYKLETEYSHNAWWWKKTVVVLFNPDKGWNPVEILDQGTWEITTEGTGIPRIVPILDDTGNPVTAGVPLDGSGRRLQPGNPLVYKEFNMYKTVAFSGIL